MSSLKKKTSTKPFSEEKPVADDVAAKSSKDDEENAADLASMSLFDLSKKPQVKMVDPQDGVITIIEEPMEDGAQVESPSELFKRMASKEPKKKIGIKSSKNEALTKGAGGEQDKVTTRYSQEQPDLSYVNPFAQALQSQGVAPTSDAKIERAAPVTPAMQELIEQVLKQMYTVTQSDKTDTVMTIQYPPLFQDARVIVSSFETARGQFNITFENLSQAAQRILDLEQNRKSLLTSLEQKGYNVQIFTTTTVLEPRLNVDQAFAQGRQQERDERENGRDQPKKRNKGDQEA